MKVVTEETKAAANPTAGVANGYTRLFNRLDRSSVDVHNVDAKEYLTRLPHLWSATPIVANVIAVSKEQAIAEDAVIISEPATKKEVENLPEIAAIAEPAAISEDKPVSARSRKLAKFED